MPAIAPVGTGRKRCVVATQRSPDEAIRPARIWCTGVDRRAAFPGKFDLLCRHDCTLLCDALQARYDGVTSQQSMHDYRCGVCNGPTSGWCVDRNGAKTLAYRMPVGAAHTSPMARTAVIDVKTWVGRAPSKPG